MPLSVATWNINSVRLRIGLVTRFLARAEPDVLCLQETKCPDANFPFAAFRKAGYRHVEIHGQKGYHGVAIVSRKPLSDVDKRRFCGKEDARHIAAAIRHHGRKITIHNLYVPAGGDEPDPEVNPKFAHKLAFVEELRSAAGTLAAPGSILVGDLNIAPLEADVWSHRQLLRVVSHTPVETEGLERMRSESGFVDLMRHFVPPRREALHLVELSLARLSGERPRPPARPHLGDTRPRRRRDGPFGAEGGALLEAPVRPRSGDRDLPLTVLESRR